MTTSPISTKTPTKENHQEEFFPNALSPKEILAQGQALGRAEGIAQVLGEVMDITKTTFLQLRQNPHAREAVVRFHTRIMEIATREKASLDSLKNSLKI